MNPHRYLSRHFLVCSLLSVSCLQGGIVAFDSAIAGDNEVTRTNWLNQIQSLDTQFSVDFEEDFVDGDNIHLQPLAGECVISSSDGNVFLTDSSGDLGGSSPVGGLSLSHDENATLLLDFTKEPVTYLSFLEIDTLGVKYVITLEGGEEVDYTSDPTAASGDSAEFVGFYSDDDRKITSVSAVSEVGDSEWGMDSLEYGNLQVLYVDAQSSGGGDGENWAQAFPTLQEALSAANPPTSILIAEGAYRPDEGPGQVDDDPNSSFELEAGIGLYGGFPTGGTDFANRSSGLSGVHQVFLLGTLGGQVNAYQVVRVFEPTESGVFRLEDIIISGGKAEGAYPFNSGGGMSVRTVFPVSVTPILERCTFLANTASASAGALIVVGSNVRGTDCLFRGNECGSSGGAVSLSGSSQVSEFFRCRFEGNFGPRAGAMSINQVQAELQDCLLAGNFSETSGSALSASSGARYTLTNCTLQGNRVEGANANSILGTIYLSSAGTSSSLLGENCLIWNNSAQGQTDLSRASLEVAAGSMRFDRSLVENWTAEDLNGDGNLDGTDAGNDPRFFDPTPPSLAPTVAGDLRLIAGSPAIDAGDTFTGISSLDLAGGARVLDGDGNGTALVDMGAYEYTFGTLVGTPTILSIDYLGLQSPGNYKLIDLVVEGTSGQPFVVMIDYFDGSFSSAVQEGDVRTFTGGPETLNLVLPPSFDSGLIRLELVIE